MASTASRRSTLLASFLLFILLCISVAYWVMQLFKPASRPVAAPPVSQAAAPKTASAASLFGGHGGNTATASNYQLKGLVLASSLQDSVVILASDGKPAQAYRASREISPGVSVKEVHPGYIVLSENGATRRVELPAELQPAAPMAGNRAPPVRTATAPVTTPPPRTMPAPQQQVVTQAQPQSQQAQPAVAAQGTAPGTQPVNSSGAAQALPVQPGQPVPASSGGSAAAGTGASGAGVTAQPGVASAQQPVVVQSPPTMGTGQPGQSMQAQPAQAGAQPVQPGAQPTQ